MPGRFRSKWRRLAAGLVLLVLAAPVRAAVSGPQLGWHVIRPGDTLESLSIRYLGSAAAWPRLHELNPRILDPHWIYPGRKVLVPMQRPASTPNAQLTAVSNKVDEQPAPIDWRDAAQGDLLLERDGVRTHENSSAELLFDDGTTATVSEQSLVFIRRQTPARSSAPRKEIEIELGQAELATPASTLPAPEIEVIVGDTHTTGKAEKGGELRARHRKEGNAAQVMLYEGEAHVATAGGAIDLPTGSGTIVRGDQRPGPAEKLLPAPDLVAPADGFEFPLGQPVVLEWKAVGGADHYLVELCGDSRCGAQLVRIDEVRETRLRLPNVPKQGGYWRVTAIASSGLDGYPSPARFLRPPMLTTFDQ
jgi:hypothetical protein